MTVSKIILGDRSTRTAAIVCILSLGGFLAWSTLAPLAEGVTAFGKVVVDNDRKVVQHLEGGIIQNILVREGDRVDAGQPLVVLTDVAAYAGRDQLVQDLVNLRAAADRLSALLDESGTLAFSSMSDVEIGEARLNEILNRQRRLFDQQRRTHQADVAVLTSRKRGFVAGVNSRQAQIASSKDSLDIVSKDLARHRQFLADKLVQASKVTQLERDEAALRTELARLTTQQQHDRSQILDIEREIAQVKARFDENATGEFLVARAQIAETEEQLTTAQDVVNRTTIYAPQAGIILNLKFSTDGGVVRPGEPILEIVPQGNAVVATVQVRPSDREAVYQGLRVQTRLSGLNSWHAPGLEGEVVGVSADLKTSPNGEFSYYEVRVRIDEASLAELAAVDATVIPGMPVEAFIFSGQMRTLLDYLIEPISTTWRRGART